MEISPYFQQVSINDQWAIPSNHPFLDGVFPYKPAIFGYPNDYQNFGFRHLATLNYRGACALQPRLGARDLGEESAQELVLGPAVAGIFFRDPATRSTG